MTKQFRDFESAREFVRKLKLKNTTEWKEYLKSGNKPDDIPVNPDRTYKNEFKGLGDWLGTGKIAPKDRVYRSFTEAREFAQSLGLKGVKAWKEYCKSGNKPNNMPSSPVHKYKKDFKGWGDFLGTGRTRDFQSFTEAREFVRALNLKGDKEWREYCKSGNKPADIPSNPNRTYKKDFKEMGDFLGTGRTRDFQSFTEARELVHKLGLKSRTEWEKYCKSGNKPADIPWNPERVYKHEFKGVGDWLGTGVIASQDKVYRSFQEAREFARKLNLKNFTEWLEYCKSSNKPADIPSNPQNTYKKKDWDSWGDFLGTGNIAPYNKVYRPFKEAREFVRTLNLKGHKEWKEYCKSGNKPDDIPAAPWNTYKEWKKK